MCSSIMTHSFKKSMHSFVKLDKYECVLHIFGMWYNSFGTGHPENERHIYFKSICNLYLYLGGPENIKLSPKFYSFSKKHNLEILDELIQHLSLKYLAKSFYISKLMSKVS